MAKRNTDISMIAAKAAGAPAHLSDEVIVAETYYRWLETLFRTGELPDEARRTPAYQSVKQSMET